MSSGLDDLERRGRWGRPGSPDKAAGTGPSPPPPARAAAAPAPSGQRRSARKSKAVEVTSEPSSPTEGVERVVVYLTRAQAAWIRERQIEALRSGRRVSTSKLIRDLITAATSKPN